MDQQFLRRLHAELGGSQAAFGRKLGISQSQVSRALSGQGHLNDQASAMAFEIAERDKPEIAREARLLEQTMKALRESERFRDLVRAALALIQKPA